MEELNRSAFNWSSWPSFKLDWFAGRSILLVGGSTLRMMATDLMMHTRADRMHHFKKGSPLHTNLRCPGEWVVKSYDCNETLGMGCPDCVCCCGPTCTTKAHNESYTIRSEDNPRQWKALFFGWSDFTAKCASLDVTLEFTWKPELFSLADVAAFSSRFCATDADYDVVLVGKGLHDAAFKKQAITLFRSTVQSKVEQLRKLMNCLNRRTTLIVRTPYAVDSRQTLKASPQLIKVVRDTLISSHLTSSHHQILDAYALTSNHLAPRPYDGIHYPPKVQMWMWQLLWEMALANRTLQEGPSTFTGGTRGRG